MVDGIMPDEEPLVAKESPLISRNVTARHETAVYCSLIFAPMLPDHLVITMDVCLNLFKLRPDNLRMSSQA